MGDRGTTTASTHEGDVLECVFACMASAPFDPHAASACLLACGVIYQNGDRLVDILQGESPDAEGEEAEED